MYADSTNVVVVDEQDNRRTSRAWGWSAQQVWLSHRPLSGSPLNVENRAGQIWDPTLGAFRAQRLPIALSKSSIATNVKTEITNGAQSPRHSISSYSSKASSVGSSATAYTYLSAHSLPPSLVSQPSSYSLKTKARAKASHHVVFRALPPEVYDCILLQLRVVHETPGSQSCQTCYLRDLCSLSLTSRAWDKVVVKRL